MKFLKMLMMAAFSILTITAFAQKQSNKELMKTGVMKIQPQYKTSKEAFLVTLSVKELMKTDILKSKNNTQNDNTAVAASTMCPDCIILFAISPKEQMKYKLMDLYRCSMSPDRKVEIAGRCTVCGIGIPVAKN